MHFTYNLIAASALVSVALAAEKIAFSGLPSTKAQAPAGGSYLTFSYKGLGFPAEKTQVFLKSLWKGSNLGECKDLTALEAPKDDGSIPVRCTLPDFKNAGRAQLYLKRDDSKLASKYSPTFHFRASPNAPSPLTAKSSDKAHDAKENAKDSARDAKDAAKQAANEGKDAAKQTAQESKDAAARKVDEAKNAAGRKVDDAKDSAKDASRKTHGMIRRTVNKIGNFFKASANKVGDGFNWVGATTKKVLRIGRNKTSETVQSSKNAFQRGADKSKTVAEKAAKAADPNIDAIPVNSATSLSGNLQYSGLAMAVASVAIIVLA